MDDLENLGRDYLEECLDSHSKQQFRDFAAAVYSVMEYYDDDFPSTMSMCSVKLSSVFTQYLPSSSDFLFNAAARSRKKVSDYLVAMAHDTSALAIASVRCVGGSHKGRMLGTIKKVERELKDLQVWESTKEGRKINATMAFHIHHSIYDVLYLKARMKRDMMDRNVDQFLRQLNSVDSPMLAVLSMEDVLEMKKDRNVSIISSTPPIDDHSDANGADVSGTVHQVTDGNHQVDTPEDVEAEIADDSIVNHDMNTFGDDDIMSQNAHVDPIDINQLMVPVLHSSVEDVVAAANENAEADDAEAAMDRTAPHLDDSHGHDDGVQLNAEYDDDELTHAAYVADLFNEYIQRDDEIERWNAFHFGHPTHPITPAQVKTIHAEYMRDPANFIDGNGPKELSRALDVEEISIVRFWKWLVAELKARTSSDVGVEDFVQSEEDEYDEKKKDTVDEDEKDPEADETKSSVDEIVSGDRLDRSDLVVPLEGDDSNEDEVVEEMRGDDGIRMTRPQAKVIREAYLSDKSLPELGSDRLRELVEKTGMEPWHVIRSLRNMFNYEHLHGPLISSPEWKPLHRPIQKKQTLKSKLTSQMKKVMNVFGSKKDKKKAKNPEVPRPRVMSEPVTPLSTVTHVTTESTLLSPTAIIQGDDTLSPRNRKRNGSGEEDILKKKARSESDQHELVDTVLSWKDVASTEDTVMLDMFDDSMPLEAEAVDEEVATAAEEVEGEVEEATAAAEGEAEAATDAALPPLTPLEAARAALATQIANETARRAGVSEAAAQRIHENQEHWKKFFGFSGEEQEQ